MEEFTSYGKQLCKCLRNSNQIEIQITSRQAIFLKTEILL